jgi:molecular chaperone DnaJ
MPKSLYEVLGVSKNASQDEIKKAYRKLVREVHPDRNPGNEERFKEVQGAYDVLSEPDKRKQYDRFGSANGRVGTGPGGTTFDVGDFDLGDLFGGIFNRGGGREQPQRGQRGNDVEVEVRVSF